MAFQDASHSFESTRWTLIQRAASADGAEARRTRNEIFAIYRSPIQSSIHRYRPGSPEIEDLTQGLCAKLIGDDFFARFHTKATAHWR